MSGSGGKPSKLSKSKQSTIKIREDLKEFFAHNDENGKLTCKLCSLKEDQSSTSTGSDLKYDPAHGWFNQERHLTRVHSIPKERFQGAQPKKELNKYFLSTVKTRFSVGSCYSKKDARQIRFETDVLDFIAIDGVPLDVTSRPGFVKMVKNLNSSVRIPSRRTIGRHLANEIKKIRKEQRTMLESSPWLHISLDLWSSKSRCSVLGVKLHFVDANFQLHNWTIGFKHFSVKKTGHNLRLFLKNFLTEELQIRADQIVTVMADNASENVKAFDLLEFVEDQCNLYDGETLETEDDKTGEDWEDVADEEVQEFSNDFLAHTEANEESDEDVQFLSSEVNTMAHWTGSKFQRLGCIAHAIQLVIKDGLNGSGSASSIVDTCNALVSFFHKSNFWSTRLYKKTKLHIAAIGKTRWNSVVIALERLLTENFIDRMNEVLLETKTYVPKIKGPEPLPITMVATMKELSEILILFKALTDQLQSDSVTSSLVLTGIIKLYNELAKLELKIEEMSALRNNLCLLLVERFGADVQNSYKGRGPRKQLLQVFSKKEYVIGSILDPRIKLKPFQMKIDQKFGLQDYIPSKEEAVKMMKDALQTLEDTEKPSAIVECSLPSEKTQPPKKKSKLSLFDDDSDDELAESTSDGSKNSSSQQSLFAEIDEYLNSPKSDKITNPLQYWKQNRGKYPHLSQYAIRYLGVPASSGSVERLFSVAGSIGRARRANIAIQTLENLLLYRDWRLHNSEYK